MAVEKEQYFDNDELKIYRGEDFIVSKHIKIHQPILGEICDYGEQKYYSMVHSLLSTPASMKAQLWQAGIDYTTIPPFRLFIGFICKIYPVEATSLLFGDLDFTKFQIQKRVDSDDLFLYQIVDDDLVAIDEFTYNIICDYLSKAHFIERDFKYPANESTKMFLIEDAIEEMMLAKNKPYHSQLKNLISAMINSEGFKYNHSQIWDMKINAFMDSVKRIGKIKNASLLLQSGYSGFGVNLKDISNKQLDWLGELE